MTIRRRSLLAALACLPRAGRAADPPRLVAPLAAEPQGLIPGLSDNFETRLVGTKIYQGLVRIGPGAVVLPELASLEASESDRRFTARMRPGLTWHDGTPCTAADAVFSIARFHRTLSRRTGPLLAGLEEAAVVDPLTATFRFAEPFGAFPYLADALSLPIVPEHIHGRGDGRPDPMPFRPIGTGPYGLLAFGRLARFPGHGGPLPAFEEIAFPVLDADARRALMQSGQSALLAGGIVEWAALPQWRQLDSVVVMADQPPNIAATVSLTLNTAAPPLDNQGVRQALSQVIDRAALLRDVWGGLGVASTGPLASISRFAGAVVARYDVRSASLALNAAGLRPDDAGIRGELHLLHPAGPPWPLLAARLVAMLRQVAIVLTAEPVAPDMLASRIAAGTYQLAVVTAEQRADPSLDLGAGFADAEAAAATTKALVEAMARIWLVEPAIPTVRDRGVEIPGGLYSSFGDATLAP